MKLAPTTFGPPPPFAVMRRGEVPFVSSAALDSKQTHTHAGFPNKQSELRERPFKRASPSSTTKYVVLSGSIPTPPIFQIALKGGRRRRIPQNTPPPIFSQQQRGGGRTTSRWGHHCWRKITPPSPFSSSSTP